MVETRQVKEENKTMVIDERDHVNQDQDERPPKRKRLELNLPGHCLVRNTDFGRLVWGKIPGWKEWPGVVVRHSDCGKRPPAPHTAWLFWFQDYRISEVSLNNVVDFNNKPFPLKLSKPLKKAILESLEEARIQSGLSVMESSDLLEWGRDGLPGAQPFKSNPESCLSAKVMQKLWKIQLTVKKKWVPFPTSSSDSSSSQDSNPTDAEERRRWKPKASLLNKVRAGEYDIESLCIACSRVDCLVVAPHPFFFGGLCSDCKVDFEDNIEARGEDNIHMYCTVCGSPGELLLCDARKCDRVFCVGCVELLVTPSAVSVIKKATTWTCFLCTPHHPDTHGLLLPRHSQDEEGEFAETEEEVPEFDPASFTGQPLRVLSLFDGIATGLYVLEKLGIMVEVYFASEINKGAISVAEFNHGSKVTSIGSVEDLTDKQIANLCPIDLLLGGSPCNDLSFVNPKRKGLMDPTGTGVLFFYYYRVLKEIQLCNKGRPLFWLFENVVHMAKTDSDCISLFLNCRPALVDAKHFTPQHRPRHFWGNLPGMRRSMPSDLGNVSLSHCLDKIGDRSAQVEKINCITTRPNSLKLLSGTRYPIIMNEHGDTPWITEIEKIFGFPAHYTDVGNLQVRERQSLLGRAWSVPVIRHLLTPLIKYYPLVTTTPASTDTTTTTPASTDTTTNPASTDTTTTNPASTDTTTTNPASTDTTTTNPASTDTTTTNPASTDTTTTNPASTDTTTTNPASTDTTTTTNPASTDTTTNPASTDTTTTNNPASTDTTTNPASTDTTTNPASTDTTTTNNPASTDTTTNPTSTDTTTNPASTDTTTTTNPASTDTTTNPASTDTTTTNPASTDTTTTTNPASTDTTTTTNPASTDITTTTNPASTDTTTTTNPASTDTTTTTNPASTDITTTTNPASTDTTTTTTTNPASTDTTTTTNPASTDTTTTTNPASTDTTTTTTTNPASTDITTTTNPASTDITTTTNPASTDTTTTTTTNPASTDTTTTTNPASTDTTTTTNPASTDTTTTTNPASTDITTTTNPASTDTTTTTNPASTDTTTTTTTNPASTDITTTTNPASTDITTTTNPASTDITTTTNPASTDTTTTTNPASTDTTTTTNPASTDTTTTTNPASTDTTTTTNPASTDITTTTNPASTDTTTTTNPASTDTTTTTNPASTDTTTTTNPASTDITTTTNPASTDNYHHHQS
ncbi:hypothetical protein Pmani_016973 [Petrolisthes manimaculis]|uniref:DNA (cytosine-5-)-methyltransferase n=1 Tax=Petrolisthes manimaculis TaxID=1843537 RepID=A0AAE1PMN9_9EUCA|nr:hypothetical protein Pmani_016973 [Petrolisthes manimaculis]